MCVDERGGMLFNRRRQSRDRAVTEDLIASLGEAKLYMAPMSESLFRDTEIRYVADENFLHLAGKDDVCFVEDRRLSEFSEQIEKVTRYCWNRHYPSDLSFDLDLPKLGFCLSETREFEGYSHEKITKEIYCK